MLTAADRLKAQRFHDAAATIARTAADPLHRRRARNVQRMWWRILKRHTAPVPA